MLLLTISVDGIPDMQRAIDRFTDGVNDLSDAWSDVRDEFFAIEQEQFDSEGGEGASGGWQALSPAYAKWKEANYGSLPILQRTGALMESLTSESGNTFVDMQPMEMTIGTNLEYALYHQEGTSRMAARPVIDMRPATETRLSRVLQDFCRRKAQEAFAGVAEVQDES